MPTTYTKKATERKANTGLVVGKGEAGSLKVLLCSTVELAAATAAGSTVKFGTIPSNARITGMSKVYWDDLTTAGSPTLDIGLGAVDANVTDDPDALTDGLDISSAGSDEVVKDISNYGLPAWDYVNGVTSDPGGELEVYGTVADAAHTTTGTVTVELLGYLD